MSARRQLAEKQGRRGEAFAALYLQLMGWRILARRVKTSRGEIDLVARRGNVVSFVEVKWRAQARQLDQAIDARRLSRVAAAVQAVGPRYAKSGEDIRIDVLLLAPWCWPRRIANAWQPGA